MHDDDILQSFEKLLTDLEVELRYEKGDFQGGICRYKEKKQLILHKNLSSNQKIVIMANELKTNFDLDNLYLVPALREVIGNAGRLG